MFHRKLIFLMAALALTIATAFWGCKRLDGDPAENLLPEVSFVNVPLDSTVFNFAPVVRWIGHDPDGMITAYQYHDDSTDAAVAAYEAGDEALRAYINNLPESAWITTYSTSDTIYLRRTETDSITQHIFMVRAVDDLGGISPVKVRTFFRTNQPPYAPRLKWALDVSLDTPLGFRARYTVPDTLFWGDTLTSTYGGIGFLWQGSDPDSRELNIIPLTFSWLLVKESPRDTVPYPVRDDSNRVIGYATGWSPWSSSTQATFSAASALASRPDFELDGNYRFYLRVRDDGLTEADSIAEATFTAVRPLFDKQLLIVDWNKTPAASDLQFGLTDDAAIMNFYRDVVPEAFEIAERLRLAGYSDPRFPQSYIPEPFVYSADQVLEFADKQPNSANRVPYDHIRHFKWVWVINDNPAINPPPLDAVRTRLKVLQDYLNVGGQVMISGRRLFYGSFNMAQCGPVVPSPQNYADVYFGRYQNLTTICAKTRHNPADPTIPADFGGATTTDPFLPNLEVDTAKVRGLNFRNTRYSCLPEIDYFGRSGGISGSDFSQTLYNYSSCTASLSYEVTNVDCDVARSTPAQAFLLPARGHTRVLFATRVYNVTKGVAGEYVDVRREQLPNGTLGNWQIIVSTPAAAGAWTNDDVLEVDYTYIPIDPADDQPVATNYLRMQGVLTGNFDTGEFVYEAQIRFRTSVFTFPFYFIKNDPIDVPFFPGLQATPIAQVMAVQLIYFNQPRIIRSEF